MVPTVIIHKPYIYILKFISNTKNYCTIPVICGYTLTSKALSNLLLNLILVPLVLVIPCLGLLIWPIRKHINLYFH